MRCNPIIDWFVWKRCHGGLKYLMCYFLLVVLSDLFSRVDTHLSRFEGLEAAPHGPLKDLLHLVFTLVDAEVTTAVFVMVLLRKRGSDRPNEMQTICMCVCWRRAIHTCFLLLYRCCCRRWWALMSSTELFLSCPWISPDIEGIVSFLINKR